MAPTDKPVVLTSNERLSQIREHDFPILLEFHSKHALGPLTRPSCLVCGRVPEQWPPAIQHAELPGIVVCHPCRDRATHETLAPSSNGNNALPVGAEDDPLLVWVLERYENCIRLAAQKKGQDRDGWLEDATHFQAVLKRLAAHGNETRAFPQAPETDERYNVSDGLLETLIEVAQDNGFRDVVEALRELQVRRGRPSVKANSCAGDSNG